MSTQPAPVAFAVEVDEGLGEEEQAAFNSVCEKVRDGLSGVEGASRLQKIKLVAPGVAEVYCKCTPGECAKSVKSVPEGKTSVLLAQLKQKIKVHLDCKACKKCASSAAAPPPSVAATATSQPLEPTSEDETPPSHPLTPYLSPSPPLANTTKRVEKRVEKARDYLQVTSAATAEQVRCAFLRRLGAAAKRGSSVGVAHVVHAYRTLTGAQGPDTVTSDELEAAQRVRQADESFASWSSEQVHAALMAGLLEFSDARGCRFPREELTYSSAKGWSCSFSVEYHVEVVPPMVSQLRLARAALPLNRLHAKCKDHTKLHETFTKVPTRAERDKLLDTVARMREGEEYRNAREKLELYEDGCEEARFKMWRNARQSLPVDLPPTDKCIRGLPPCQSEYARGCCRCCKEVDDEDAGDNRWILVTFEDTDIRELPPAYWQPLNPLKADEFEFGVDAVKPFWEMPELLYSACDCKATKGLCVCKSFFVRACLLASVRETGKPPAFLGVQEMSQPSPHISEREPLGYFDAKGEPDVSLLGAMADGTPRRTFTREFGGIRLVARADDLLLVRLCVPAYLKHLGVLEKVVRALLPSAYEPILAPSLRGTVSTAAERRSKQAVRENLADYSKSIIDKLAKPTNDLRASLGITAADADAMAGDREDDNGEYDEIYKALGPCNGVATPTAIAFEATKQRKLQEAVDDAVHREVHGVLADLVSIVAAQEDKPLGEAGLRASMGLAEKKVDVSPEKQQRALVASNAIHEDPAKRRELMQWLSTRQPGLFKTEDRFSSKLTPDVKRRPDWLDGGVKRARCA